MKNNTFILPTFTLPIRVYYEDTDAGGVVYHSNYLNFMERARTELLRTLGYDQDVLTTELGVLFVVRSIQLDYLKAARFNQQLEVMTSIAKLGRASIVFQQDIRCIDQPMKTTAQRDSDGYLTSAQVKVACVEASSFKPRAIPLPIKFALNGENGEN